jgi:hypothetical protein
VAGAFVGVSAMTVGFVFIVAAPSRVAGPVVAAPSRAVGPVAAAPGRAGPVPWRVVPVAAATAATLAGVSCPAPTDCVAVGSETPADGSGDGSGAGSLIESWDGRRWSVAASPVPSGPDDDSTRPGASLAGVSCSSAAWCVAVGSNESQSESAPLIESRAGGRWRLVANRAMADGPGGSLAAVSCLSPAACVAVGSAAVGGGSRPLVERYDGRTWSVSAGPAAADVAAEQVLDGVSCVITMACTAVGYGTSFDPLRTTTLIEVSHGSTWSVVPGPEPGPGGSTLTAISCVSTDDCTAVGTEGVALPRTAALIESWNGLRWSLSPPLRLAGSVRLEGVSCPSTSTCTAVGTDQPAGGGIQPLILRSVRGRWRSVPLEGRVRGGARLQAVSCERSGACTSAGVSGVDSALVLSDQRPVVAGRGPLRPVLAALLGLLVLAAAAGAAAVVLRLRHRDRMGRTEGAPGPVADTAVPAAVDDPAAARPAGVDDPPDPMAPVEPEPAAPGGTAIPAPGWTTTWGADPEGSSVWAPPDR